MARRYGTPTTYDGWSDFIDKWCRTAYGRGLPTTPEAIDFKVELTQHLLDQSKSEQIANDTKRPREERKDAAAVYGSAISSGKGARLAAQLHEIMSKAIHGGIHPSVPSSGVALPPGPY